MSKQSVGCYHKTNRLGNYLCEIKAINGIRRLLALFEFLHHRIFTSIYSKASAAILSVAARDAARGVLIPASLCGMASLRVL
jgi:hypothetical protein